MSVQEQPVVIHCAGVSKRYRLGEAGGATLSEDLGAWLARLRGKPDPRIPIGKEVDSQVAGRDFWALRDVGFEVHRGETLGIIGRNGAGKSTLLKLLSRITLPTEGEIRMRGRMSSLLEVGTGFNPELTGRENIFLNGTILGMRKAEIDRKLDEIIAFSGVRHHIDSPVKRYSSGMKVRLGFSVAAHLEPEILVIDEVLAVGDAEFQRKCLGKMKDVAHHGRTILFVSHNMTAIASLCSRVIWLHDGRVRMDGPTSDVVRAYLGTYASHSNERRWVVGQDAPGNDLVRLTGVSIEPDATTDGEELLDVNTSFKIRIHYHNSGITDDDMNVTIQLYNAEDIMVFTSGWRQFGPHTGRVASGAGSVWCAIPAQLLNTGNHRIVVNFFRNGKMMFQVEETIGFEVHEGERTGSWYGRLQGVVRPRLQWGTN
ncbi:MAG: ABC transporter ATP-binding protein [Bacteroidetes bacterium]|nr:ABC transporter ATP-binding protein [Bacteroidota bacterium]MBX7129753.1 ABC transporter ATP-binding protein [Flavobacteriales bacterium]HMU13460.1 ABC transporter ATP-binding protein [Flavobacteriales bacterium]HMZ48371.1 ABC transporter ATP-binding protein [Flavobacteriales bacterium]HNI05472.1 ABC transporter ATP-binding protein [Flavobacteriales bacterium]